jgi:predicted transcriptional regulator
MLKTHCRDKCKYVPHSIPGPIISVGQNITVSPYLLGYRGCSTCERLFKNASDGVLCECCGRKLRTPEIKFKKMARNHPELVAQLQEHVTKNAELRKRRDELSKQKQEVEEQMRDSVEKILQTRNKLEEQAAILETKTIMSEYEIEEMSRTEEKEVVPTAMPGKM